MIRHPSILLAALLVAAGAAGAATLAEMKKGPLSSDDPQALVHEFVDADAQGMQTSSDHWPLVRRFAVWEDGPGWDTVTVVTGAEVGRVTITGRRASVPVRYTVLGELHDDGDYNPVLQRAKRTRRTVTFRLVRRKDGWKIVAPQDGPRVSIPQLLDDRYKEYCATRDCNANRAISALRAEQAAHPFGIAVVRRPARRPRAGGNPAR